ncbi:hypothetical protein Glove_406g102 [Diversispora epigaea]|uniref:Uncharacterized protein n=1 Tax=Diversispora epigaea TaxID=1348612 RepID=A0A397H313_9GLOM|nr:hypothetical protein Glove_406g102 [Diversispora epigaea]
MAKSSLPFSSLLLTRNIMLDKYRIPIACVKQISVNNNLNNNNNNNNNNDNFNNNNNHNNKKLNNNNNN